MMDKFISSLTLLSLSFFTPVQNMPVGDSVAVQNQVQNKILAQKTMDLSTRHPDKWVNGVFSDNILLNLHYLKGDAESLKDGKGNIDWEKVREPFEFTLTLESNQTFAYHRTLLAEFKDKNVLVGKTRFLASEGYKSDGYLIGDGVCHLATLFNWVAQEAGLKVKSMVNHDFLPVPEIPREFGTSIFYTPDGSRNSANQNLYITNNFSVPVKFDISVNGRKVEIKIRAEGVSIHQYHDIPFILPV